MPSGEWSISRAAADAMIAHARGAAPRECCGLLLGMTGRIDAAWPAANVDPHPARFMVAPEDHFAAIRHARASGQSVIGAYHSHPHSAAAPSPSDEAEALYPEFLYVIVGLATEPPEMKAYALERGRLRAVGTLRVL